MKAFLKASTCMIAGGAVLAETMHCLAPDHATHAVECADQRQHHVKLDHDERAPAVSRADIPCQTSASVAPTQAGAGCCQTFSYAVMTIT